MSGNYRRNLNSGSNETEYNSWGNINQNLSGSLRESKYVGIIGKLGGFSLTKSNGQIAEQTTVSMTDENGTTQASGSMASASSGKTNTLTQVSGVDTSTPGTTISINLFNMTGGEGSESFAGMFAVDSADSVTAVGSGGFIQKAHGLSVSSISLTPACPVQHRNCFSKGKN